MDKTQLSLPAVLSSLLFVSGRPLSVSHLAELSKSTDEEVLEALGQLKKIYCEELLGVELVQVAERWQLRTAPGAKDIIERMIPISARKLSKAAAETLAVVAYKQPVQKADIDSIRGVDSFPTLKTLLEAKLVRVIGHDDRPGQPALYATTQRFLEKFGLNDLNDLPNIREVQRIVSDPGEASAIDEDDDADGLEEEKEGLAESS